MRFTAATARMPSWNKESLEKKFLSGRAFEGWIRGCYKLNHDVEQALKKFNSPFLL